VSLGLPYTTCQEKFSPLQAAPATVGRPHRGLRGGPGGQSGAARPDPWGVAAAARPLDMEALARAGWLRILDLK
ncbi:MAG: hypothetical protein ACE5JI_15890, partial [Acidobacteriota bacterium]